MRWWHAWMRRPTGPTPGNAREVLVPGVGVVRVEQAVDCMGAMCPRPQLLAVKTLAQVNEGEVIEMVLDNPTAVEGFPALAMTLLCTHLASVREIDRWRIYLRKGL